MSSLEELKTELENLSVCFRNLEHLWFKVESETKLDLNDYLVDDYPFDATLEDVVCRVSHWVDEGIYI